jgi:ParB-like nuclease domain
MDNDPEQPDGQQQADPYPEPHHDAAYESVRAGDVQTIKVGGRTSAKAKARCHRIGGRNLMLAVHPFADVFPPMNAEELTALAADIRANGLREPIVLHEGMILDGRNRYRACCELGIEPITRPWDSKGDPLSFVVSKNLHRRHLSETQRAVVANKLATLKQGARTDLPQICGRSQAEAAETLNVSPRSVQNAHVVAERGIPELNAMVAADEVSVSAASVIATLPKRRQLELVARGSKGIVRAAKKIRVRRAVRKAAGRRFNTDDRPQATEHEEERKSPEEREELVKEAEAGEHVSARIGKDLDRNLDADPEEDSENYRDLGKALLDGTGEDACEAILLHLGVGKAKRIVRALDKRMRNLKPDCLACSGTGFRPAQASTLCGIPLWQVKIKCDCSPGMQQLISSSPTTAMEKHQIEVPHEQTAK